MDKLHESELSTVTVIRGKGEYFGARTDRNPRTSEPARPSVNSTFHSTPAVPRHQIPIVDGFRKPAPLPPRQGDGSSVIVFDLDAHDTCLCLPAGALHHFQVTVNWCESLTRIECDAAELVDLCYLKT